MAKYLIQAALTQEGVKGVLKEGSQAALVQIERKEHRRLKKSQS